MTVTCDTSPLPVLAKTGRLELLGTLYDAVWIPSAVLEEVKDPDRSGTRAIRQWAENEPSVAIHPVSEAVWASIPEDLGEGERTAIALAVARGGVGSVGVERGEWASKTTSGKRGVTDCNSPRAPSSNDQRCVESNSRSCS